MKILADTDVCWESLIRWHQHGAGQGRASNTVKAVATSLTDSETTGLSAGALAGIIVDKTVALVDSGAGEYLYSQSPQREPNTQGAIHDNQVRPSLKSREIWACHCPSRSFMGQKLFLEPGWMLKHGTLQGPPVWVPPSVQPAMPQTTATAPSTPIYNNSNLAALVRGQ